MSRNKIVKVSNNQVFDGNVIMDCRFSKSLNLDCDLEFGSTASSLLEVKLWGNTPQLKYGDNIRYYQDDVLVATLKCEKVTIESRNIYKVVAYDMMVQLTKSAYKFVSSYNFSAGRTMVQFANDLCSYANITCDFSGTYPNSQVVINKFNASNLTIRQLLGYVAQVCGRYAYAMPDGKISFGWVKGNDNYVISPGNGTYGIATKVAYLSDSLKKSNFTTSYVGGVAIKKYGKINAVYPEEATSEIYYINTNPILNKLDDSTLSTVVQNLFGIINPITYVPFESRLMHTKVFDLGDIVTVIDGNGNTFQSIIFSMNYSPSGLTVSSTGNASRDSATSVYKETSGEDKENISNLIVDYDEIVSSVTDYVVGGENLIENAIDLKGHTFK